MESLQSLIQLRWMTVWRRNLLVWTKLIGPALLYNFGEPILYLLALGYGLGFFVGEIQGLPYIVFLASGIVCTSAMNSASFEALYSAFTRMEVQRTWDAMLLAPLNLADVFLGEMIWAASKGLLSAVAIMIVAGLLGHLQGGLLLWALPILFLLGLCFAAMAFIMTAVAKNYDFFVYYFTLFITPMFLLSGVFFPLETMHPTIRGLTQLLPLTHGVTLVRPLLVGGEVNDVMLHIGVIVAYTVAAYSVAMHLLKKRLFY